MMNIRWLILIFHLVKKYFLVSGEKFQLRKYGLKIQDKTMGLSLENFYRSFLIAFKSSPFGAC